MTDPDQGRPDLLALLITGCMVMVGMIGAALILTGHAWFVMTCIGIVIAAFIAALR